MATSSVIANPERSVPVQETEQLYFERFTERELVEQIVRKWDEADQRLRPFFDVATQCYDQYRNKQDFSDKEDWQSRVTIPKAHAAVKQGVANIRKLFVQARDIVLVEDPSGFNSLFAPYVQEGVKRLWDHAGFLEVTSEALEAGLIMGLLAGRQDWVYDNITVIQPDATGAVQPTLTRQGRLLVRPVDPWSIRWGPETDSNKIDWIIEERLVSISTLKQLGLNVPEDIWREDAKLDEQATRHQRRTDEPAPKERYEHQAKVWEYWGDLIDEKTQELVARDVHIILLNKKRLSLAEPNPLWRKRPPYVLCSPSRVAFRFPGQGILEVNQTLKANIDAIAQMATDYLKFSTLVMLEGDVSMLENPEDLATGIEPGKIFRKRPGTGPAQALRQIGINPLQADVFNMMLGLDKEYQRGTFITEVVQGLLDAKGESTATEVQTTLSQSTIMLASIARDLEEQWIEPMADLTWDLALQFMDINSLPNWTRILGPAGQRLDLLPRGQRFQMIQGNYEFKARGVSLQVERQVELQKLIQYVGFIGQYFPQFVPILNLPALFKRIHEAFSFPLPGELLSPNADQLFAQMQQNTMLVQSPEEQMAQKVGPQLIQGLIQNVIQGNKAQAASQRAKKPAQ